MKPKNLKTIVAIAVLMTVIVITVILIKMNPDIEINDITEELPRQKGKAFETRNVNDINEIIIHHSASPQGKFNPFDFARWHIDPEGRLNAPGICYHFAIEPNGKIYQVNKLTSIAWHTINRNTNSIAIELNGNFENEEPTPEQLQATKKLIKFLKTMLNKNLIVKAHKDYNSTACPGKNIMKHSELFT